MRKRRKKSFLSGKKIQIPHISKWVLLPLFIFVIFFLVPRLIRINSIDCESQFGPCNSVISSELKNIEGQSYFEASKNITKFFERNALVSDFTVKFNLPGKFVVEVVEKKPIVSFVKRSQEQKYYFIDSQGLVLYTQENSQLPKIIFPDDSNLNVGEVVSPDFLFSARVLQGCFITFGSRLAILTPEFIEVDLPDSIKVRFPLRGDTNLLLGSLNVILSRLNINVTDSKIKLIDLRFKNPVLKHSYD